MVKSNGTHGKPKIRIDPIPPLSEDGKKNLKKIAKVFIEMRKWTALPHFMIEMYFFSEEAEEFFKKELDPR